MSFLFPRTISIYRNLPNTSPGVQGYNYPNENTVVSSDISASIQLWKESGSNPAGLPGDVSKRVYWRIMFKGGAGLCLDGDVIHDDLGQRYQVTAAYWNFFGYQCLCERLES